ncbi:MAG: endolytic transglycosylase MltG, partial [Bdellovibrionota bacterium]
YNTRIHPGLPPTPICSPGLPSLAAVVSPSGHGYLYYVVDADDFSKHRFAKKLSEHNQNVKAYWKAKRIADAAAQK